MSLVTKPVQVPIVIANKFSQGFKALNEDIKKTTGNFAKMNKALLDSSAMIAQKGQSLKKYGESMTKVGTNLSLKVTAPILAIGAAAIKASADMQKGMQNVASLGVGQKRIKELSESVSSLTEQLGEDTTTVTDGLYQVVSAFGDSADTAKILEINGVAAAAGLATLKDSVNLTSAVTKAYGDTSATAVQHVSDLAFEAVKLGQTTFPELAASIGSVTPLTKELGVSQENLFGIMGTATGVTGNADEVATQLKGVMSSLLSPTKAMTDLYKKMGVAGGKELIAKQGGIAETMKLIVDYSKKTKRPLSDYIGLIRGQVLALSMAGPQYDTLITKTKAMMDVQGAAAGAFAEQMKAPYKQFAQFREMLVNAADEIGQILIPVLIDVMNDVKPIIKAFRDLSPETKKNIVIFAGIAAAIGPVLVVAGSLVTAVGSLMTAFGFIGPMILTAAGHLAFLKGIILSLANPITLLGTVFVATFTIATKLFKNFFTNILGSNAPQWVKDFALSWLGGFEALKGYAADFGKWFIQWAKDIGKGMLNDLLMPFRGLKDLFNIIAPKWVKQGFGIKVSGDSGTGVNVQSQQKTNPTRVSPTQIQQIHKNIETNKTITNRQQQEVTINIPSAPTGTTAKSTGRNVANLNLGFAQ